MADECEKDTVLQEVGDKAFSNAILDKEAFIDNIQVDSLSRNISNVQVD